MEKIIPNLIKLNQFWKTLYYWFINFSQIKGLYRFSIRSDENIDWLNRVTDQNKINQISKFIFEQRSKWNTGMPIFVSPIIFWISLIEWIITLNNNSLKINTDLVEEEDKALIVDGQHRIRWLEEYFKNLNEDDNKIDIPVVFLIDYSNYQLAEVFATINFKQKPVNKSLYFDIFGASPYLPISEMRISHILLKNLNSKFKKIVKMLPNDTEWKVSQWFLGQKLEKILGNKNVWLNEYKSIENRFLNSEEKEPTENTITLVDSYKKIENEFLLYFSVIDNKFKEFWEDWILYKTTWIWALLRLLEDFYIFQSQERTIEEEFKDGFSKIENSSDLFWVSWKYAKNSSEWWQNELYKELEWIVFLENYITEFSTKFKDRKEFNVDDNYFSEIFVWKVKDMYIREAKKKLLWQLVKNDITYLWWWNYRINRA